MLHSELITGHKILHIKNWFGHTTATVEQASSKPLVKKATYQLKDKNVSVCYLYEKCYIYVSICYLYELLSENVSVCYFRAGLLTLFVVIGLGHLVFICGPGLHRKRQKNLFPTLLYELYFLSSCDEQKLSSKQTESVRL